MLINTFVIHNAYFNSRRKIVLEEPKFDRALGLFQNAKHHDFQETLVEMSASQGKNVDHVVRFFFAFATKRAKTE